MSNNKITANLERLYRLLSKQIQCSWSPFYIELYVNLRIMKKKHDFKTLTWMNGMLKSEVENCT